MKRKVLALAGAVSILSGMFVTPVVLAGSQSIETCVTNYEDSYGWWDYMTICATPASGIAVPDLYYHTENLTGGGCEGMWGNQPNWRLCISSARVGNLPANYKVEWYADANYQARYWCYDVDGNSPLIDLSNPAIKNDSTISFRVIAGNC